MSTHSSLRKRKLTGGKKRAYRSKKKYEAGGFPAETVLGEPKRKTTRGMGGNGKIKALTDKFASVTHRKAAKPKNRNHPSCQKRSKRRLQPQRRHNKRRRNRNRIGPSESHKQTRQRRRNQRSPHN